MNYSKRLIEVDLPIKRISACAREEKSIRNGHISNLHIWWARRPLASCRAVLCASLWPDPADPLCDESFLKVAKKEMLRWSSNDHLELLSKESVIHFIKLNNNLELIDNKIFLRTLLLDFIADFSNYQNSSSSKFINTARALTKSSNLSLGGIENNPIIVDPFAGGGAFPIEAARIGADSFGGDLNSLAISLNKIILEYAPRFGNKLYDRIRHYGDELKALLHKKLINFYPLDENGNYVICYFWARTIKCEGPNCGVEVPIIRSFQFAKRAGNEAAVEIFYENKKLKSKIHLGKNANKIKGGTSKRSSVTCPKCGYTTPRKNVENQANNKGFGYFLFAVCVRGTDKKFKTYRQPTERDFEIIKKASSLRKTYNDSLLDNTDLKIIPHEELPYLRSIFNVRVYGIDEWQKLYTDRQLISAVTHVIEFRNIAKNILKIEKDKSFAVAIIRCLSLSISNAFQYQCNISTYLSDGIVSAFIQGQSLGMKMDFIESNPLMPGLVGGYEYSLDKFLAGLEYLCSYDYPIGQAVHASALSPFLPEDSVDLLATDPPYYDVIPYADCSDFFYVWLKRMYEGIIDSPFVEKLSRKDEEIVQLAERNEKYKVRTKEWFEDKMSEALHKWRLATKPNGKAIIVFAHKETKAWEALLKAVLDAGWVITASWPIDTENSGRMRANESAVLSTSIHLICEPLEDKNGKRLNHHVGDWRDVLKELPVRIHEWMPRLAEEGVVGADAIFACLGPALEIFSKYSSVEKPNGDKVTLKEYLEQIWAAVSQEALSMVIAGADAKSFEEDARLTAMWLWTLVAGTHETKSDEIDDEEFDESTPSTSKSKGGFLLEYDTARLISQGLGANLSELTSVVEIKGDVARLISVMERTPYLFGSESLKYQPNKSKKKIQTSLFDNSDEEAQNNILLPELKVVDVGKTVLDRVHQAMLLFATSRTEALKRFLLEDGIGKDDRFWKLAQALTALYPKDTEERRWVEAVQTYKKSLGF